jgi:tRNA G18 (ribose-2'-O)-methylase SpoU
MNDDITDTRNLIDKYKGESVERIAQDMRSKAFSLHIAIENLQHDFNIGSIVRSANAFNVRSVHIVGKRHWNKRGAMSTEKYLELYHHPDVESLKQWAIVNALSIYGIDIIETSKSITTTELPENLLMLFGQEGPGLSEEAKAICEKIVHIDQYGSTRSVNVGVAAGIAMFEWVRRRQLKSS